MTESSTPLNAEEVGSLASIIMVMQRRFMASLMGELAKGSISFPSFFFWGISVPTEPPA